MAFENLLGSELPDKRFIFGLGTKGLQDIFVFQALNNNCDATARLIVYRYLEKKGKAKINDKSLRTSPSLNLYAKDLNPKVEAGQYEIDFLFGGQNTYLNIAVEKAGVYSKGRDYDKALAYIDTCLKNGIPAIIGIGIPGFSSGNPDGSSDHFIVCVGKGRNGEYYYYDTGGRSGANLDSNILRPIPSKSLLKDELMGWTKGLGEKSGNVYLTFVAVYPIHRNDLNSLTPETPASPPAPQTATQSAVDTTQPQVNPETGTVDQEKSRGETPGQEQNSTQNNKPNLNFISQIVDPRLKPGVVKFPVPPQKEIKKEIADSFGNIPFIWYGSYQIDYNNIEFFQLYTGGNLPTIKLTFVDTFNLMKDSGFPLDDATITIFINPRSEQLKPIFMSFKIIKFSVDGKTYTMTGVIDANQLYIKKFKSFSKKTSFQTLKAIAEEIGLGFASNLDDTNDAMSWINPGQKYSEFIEHVVNNSYKSDETYLTSYIDYYYNLTYVDVEKELKRNIKEELGIGNIGMKELGKLDSDTVQKLVLTNDKGYRNSNSYFFEYRILNNSTSISLREGYFTKVKFYDELKKDFLVFNLSGLTSDAQDKIILKGKPQDEEFFKENTDLVYLGKLDNDNMYTNYHYSNIQNYRNLVELEKIGLEVKMKSPNYNLYKYQKVLLVLSNQTGTPAQSHFNNRLSGEWLIVDIMFKLERTSYVQTIKLVKRELELSEEEKRGEVPQKTAKRDGGRGRNTNPDPGEQANFDRQSANQVANNQTPDSGTTDSTQATDEPNNAPFTPSSAPATTPLLFQSTYQGTRYYYLIDPQNGAAGKRLRQFQKDLEAYLNKNGFSGTVLKSNGIMRDLVAAGNPKKIPARASGSLHGAGLAHDLQFAVPGIKWAGIGDNKNLAANKKLTSTIWKFVQSQKDITWGAEWGKNVNLNAGETNGFGITEYHHFEIKSNFIPPYLASYDAEIKKLGYDYRKLVSTKAMAPFYISVLGGRV